MPRRRTPTRTTVPMPASLRARASIPVLAGSLAGSLAVMTGAAPAHAAPAPAPVSTTERATHLSPAAVPTRGHVAATSVPDTVTVSPGDTVSGIAGRFGLRTDDVLHINGLTRSSVIYPGQVLRLSGAVTPAPAEGAPAASYTIVAGDTISAIAARHGTSTQALLDANGLTRSSIIYPGQSIALPGAGMTPAASVAPAAPAPVAPAPSAPVATYTIAAGDTMSAIAARHGVDVDALLAANGLGRASIIYPGQALSIPGAAAPKLASVPSVDAPLDAEQAENARTIIRVGRELGIGDRAIAIALGTAMQESWLRNLDWGDRDSLGLFQQRPSQGWGTAEQVRDTVRATRVFFGGAADPNGTATRGLLDIPGWEAMSYADAAQAVQVSAFPDRYARWEQPSYAWLAALG